VGGSPKPTFGGHISDEVKPGKNEGRTRGARSMRKEFLFCGMPLVAETFGQGRTGVVLEKEIVREKKRQESTQQTE